MEDGFDATEHRGFTRVGDYDLLRKMGAGGFGTVFEARHRLTGLPYAVKRIYLTAEDAERFRNEAIYPARVASDSMHVLGVHSFFHDDTIDAFYLVTELITHGDLRAFLDRHPRPLPLGLALEVGIGIAKGLAAIHAQRIVHRDLKPANVLMDRKDGQWVAKIADFGLARSVSSVSIAQFATSGYASPEQLDLLSDKPLGPESDLFSYGMVLYELLTGDKPTAAQGLREYGMWLGARQQPPVPSTVRPEVATWPALDALVVRLLDFDRTTRLGSAAEVVRVLDGVLRPAPVWHAAPAPPPLPAAAPVVRPISRPVDRVPSGPIANVVYGRDGVELVVPEPRWRLLLGMTGVFAATGSAMYLGLPWRQFSTSGWLLPDSFPHLFTAEVGAWDVASGVILPSLFGVALGLAGRLPAGRLVAGTVLTRLAYDGACGVAYLAAINVNRTTGYVAGGAAGALLVQLGMATACWCRPTWRQPLLLLAVGAAGGAGALYCVADVEPDWAGNTLAYMVWQLPVGLVLVDRILRPTAAARPWRWWPLLTLAAVALIISLTASAK